MRQIFVPLILLGLASCQAAPKTAIIAPLKADEVRIELSTWVYSKDGQLNLFWKIFNRSGVPLLIDDDIRPSYTLTIDGDEKHQLAGGATTQSRRTVDPHYLILAPTPEGDYNTGPNGYIAGTMVVGSGDERGLVADGKHKCQITVSNLIYVVNPADRRIGTWLVENKNILLVDNRTLTGDAKSISPITKEIPPATATEK